MLEKDPAWHGVTVGLRISAPETRIKRLSMSNEAKLGTIPTGTEGRDAVHVAIVPARSANGLVGGSPVKFNPQNEAEACRVEDAIGVVDPFRPQAQRAVPKGSWFWMCLYPKTITGLRHVWDHPSFPAVSSSESSAPNGDKSASESWLKDYVGKHCPYYEGKGYDEFLRYVKDERWIYYYGSECHSLSDVEDADELFRHLSVVLDRRIDASYFESFTCSC